MRVPITKAVGLVTNSNVLSSTPAGAFKTLDNCVIRSKDIVESRRGQAYTGDAFGSSTTAADTFFYGDYLITRHTTTTLSRSPVTVSGAGAFTDYSGTYTAPDVGLLRMKAVEALQNFYFTTSTGVKMLDVATATPTLAGVPPGIDLYTTGYTNDSSGFLECDSQVGYRYTFINKDANGRLRRGAPSPPVIAANAPLRIAAGGLVRVTNVVTMTFTGDATNLAVAETFTLDAVEGTFGVGPHTVVTKVGQVITYAETAANATSAVAHTALLPDRKVTLTATLPDAIPTGCFIQVHRTELSATYETHPGEEYFQCHESAVTAPFTLPITTGLSKPTGTTITATYTAHGLKAGALFYLGTTETYFASGVFEVLTVPGANSFTYTDAVNNPGPGTVVNTATHLVTPKTMVIIDNHPESQLGDPLYTNPRTADGPLAANNPPPLCKDVTLWQDRLWFANTTGLQRFTVQLLGVGSPDGLQNNDTITIMGETYTAATSYSVTPGLSKTFNIDATGTTPSQQIERTMYNFVRVLNAWNSSANIVNAFYVSAEDESPGKIVIEARTLGTSAFSVYASRPQSWFPALTASSSGAPTSTNGALPHGLYYSKVGDLEGVPLTNYLTAGSKNKRLLRAVPLRDRLYLFKEDGIFVVSGYNNFRVDPLDETVITYAPDSVVPLNNQIFALTNQGVVAVSDAGVQVVSAAIEPNIVSLFGTALAKTKLLTFAVAHESERTYMLWLPASSASTVCTQAYVYNTLTNAWTRWPVSRTSGAVHRGTDTLYLGDADTNKYRKERRYFTNADYADESSSKTLVSVNTDAVGYNLELSSTTGVGAGDYIQGSLAAAIGIVTAVASPLVYISCSAAQLAAFEGSSSALTVYKAIPCTMAWQTQTSGVPEQWKQVREVIFHMLRGDVYNVTPSFASELFPTATTYTKTFPSPTVLTMVDGSAGMTGSVVWAAQTPPNVLHAAVPRAHQRAASLDVGLTITEAGSNWAVGGVTLIGEAGSEKEGY